MLTEALIHNKINSIFSSYADIHGFSVDEYLMVRRAALEEIRLGFYGDPQNSSVRILEKECQDGEGYSPLPKRKDLSHSEISVAESEEPEKNEESPLNDFVDTGNVLKSDYDILRGIKDPWN